MRRHSDRAISPVSVQGSACGMACMTGKGRGRGLVMPSNRLRFARLDGEVRRRNLLIYRFASNRPTLSNRTVRDRRVRAYTRTRNRPMDCNYPGVFYFPLDKVGRLDGSLRNNGLHRLTWPSNPVL